jgi:hypothetical protein
MIHRAVTHHDNTVVKNPLLPIFFIAIFASKLKFLATFTCTIEAISLLLEQLQEKLHYYKKYKGT